MADAVSHDHNFKNLIVEYPRQALEFFAPEEAPARDDVASCVPVRQEQLKARLGGRFRELDVPLLVEWADGPPRRDPVRVGGGVRLADVLGVPAGALLSRPSVVQTPKGASRPWRL